MVSKRLMKELRDVERDPNDQVLALRPATDDDLFLWRAIIAGTKGTAYEGGRFELEIQIPQSYPIHPPTIRFKTKICHPNIHWRTGEICLDLLKTAWSPAWTLQAACLAIGVLLTTPEPDSPLNCDAANLLRCGDERGYNSLVQMYTRIHAMPSS
ncbi:ubiquitin-conjugating enzyme E2 [Chytridium lagenaria]|nr:ubiquitin-conjugating enzyme E2 [Chytridium lagenaria]